LSVKTLFAATSRVAVLHSHLERELGLHLEPSRGTNTGPIDRGRLFQDDSFATPAHPSLVERRGVLGDRHQADAWHRERRERCSRIDALVCRPSIFVEHTARAHRQGWTEWLPELGTTPAENNSYSLVPSEISHILHGMERFLRTVSTVSDRLASARPARIG